MKTSIWPLAVCQEHSMSFLIRSLAPSWLGAGGLCSHQKSGSGELSPEWQLPRPQARALPSAQLPLWSRVQVPWGHSEDPCGPQAGIPWVSQESSLPLALLTSGGPWRGHLPSFPPHHSCLCLPLQPQPLVPTLAIPPE